MGSLPSSTAFETHSPPRPVIVTSDGKGITRRASLDITTVRLEGVIDIVFVRREATVGELFFLVKFSLKFRFRFG